MKTIVIITSCMFSLHVASVWASQDSNGPNGINANGLNLTGNGIDIGQVEVRRPGDISFDTNNSLINSKINPKGVFYRPISGSNFSPNLNMNISEHATMVAGLMISTDSTATGTSTAANLFSAGIHPLPPLADIYEQTAQTANYLATLPGKDLRAINMSINISAGSDDADGNSLVTSFLDWSATTHDILYVAAGFESGGSGALPSDNFNGISVGFSEKSGARYRIVDGGNVFTSDDFSERTFIDLIAPGRNIQLAIGGNVVTTIPDPVRIGTSLAAPHVTGTVALLQEHGDSQVAAHAANPTTVPNWDTDARRHEVMKAVLINSADKLIDDGTVTVPGGIVIPTGGLLGMERTVLKQDGTSTWFDSPAYPDAVESGGSESTPLDEEMGAGHLNARRAHQQFAAGEHESFSTNDPKVPVLGWDYDTTAGKDTKNRYRINQQLQAGSFISITLAWDREVEFDIDQGPAQGGTTGAYDIGDSFEEYTEQSWEPPADHVINDLGLSLLPLGGTLFDTIAVSSTLEGTLEHLFFQIPTTGEYEFWVEQFDEETSIGITQDYAVAWWAAGTGPIIAGDFDGDGIINQGDYVAWRNSYGQSVTPGSGADANNNGLIDAADYTVWRDAFAAVGVSVPEPSSLVLIFVGIGLLATRKPL